MQPVKAIIADNDAQLIRHMESLLAEVWPELVICAHASSGPEALQLIERHRPQVAFMEVRLPEICGMQVARKIGGTCQVVFTTGHDHYAVNAYDGGALDYLLKPVGRERLSKAVRRVKKQLFFSQGALLPADDSPPGACNDPWRMQKQDFLQWICVTTGRRSRLVQVDQVSYFKADGKYTSVITTEDEALINKSIKALVESLDPNRFWRIHRSTIVNVSQIEAVCRSKTGRGNVQLRGRHEILTVSRPYLHLFKTL